MEQQQEVARSDRRGGILSRLPFRPSDAAPSDSFDALLNRIHPADSRVRLLARETPASFIAFDLLALGDESLLSEPFQRRRDLLIEALAAARAPVHAARWEGDG